jgi:hypothetical protein
MTSGAIQIAGAAVILCSYLLSLGGRLSSDSYAYLVLNLAGSLALAVIAALQPSWGFLLLEGAWSLLSAWRLLQRLRDRRHLSARTSRPTAALLRRRAPTPAVLWRGPASERWPLGARAHAEGRASSSTRSRPAHGAGTGWPSRERSP